MSQPPTGKYPDMGEVTGLRLELGRERDRANAFADALRKEVRDVIKEVIREEAAKAKPKKMYDTKPDGTIYIVAEDEEVEDLKLEVNHVKYWNGQFKAENDRLKAEVKRLEKEIGELKINRGPWGPCC